MIKYGTFIVPYFSYKNVILNSVKQLKLNKKE